MLSQLSKAINSCSLKHRHSFKTAHQDWRQEYLWLVWLTWGSTEVEVETKKEPKLDSQSGIARKGELLLFSSSETMNFSAIEVIIGLCYICPYLV